MITLLLQQMHCPAAQALQYYSTKVSVDFQQAYSSCGTGIFLVCYRIFLLSHCELVTNIRPVLNIVDEWVAFLLHI
jgi:hypothetical protein